jgi:hypothetical protein
MKTIIASLTNNSCPSGRIFRFQLKIRSIGFVLFAAGFLIILSSMPSFAQGVGISESAITPDASAVLEVRSTARGFLPPRLSATERDAITTPANGLMIFNTTTGEYNIYDSGWMPLSIKREFDQLTADFTTASATLTPVTGLDNFSLEANANYYFKFKCLVTTNAVGVGILLSINSSAAVSAINYIHMYPTSATAVTYEQVTALLGGTLPAAGPGATRREYSLEGTITTSTAVTISLLARTETTVNVVVRAGSFGWFKKI